MLIVHCSSYLGTLRILAKSESLHRRLSSISRDIYSKVIQVAFLDPTYMPVYESHQLSYKLDPSKELAVDDCSGNQSWQCLNGRSWSVLQINRHCAPHRFLAEVPQLEEERVRKLLDWLISIQDGTAACYLLQLLVFVTSSDSPQASRQKWIHAARKAKVRPLILPKSPCHPLWPSKAFWLAGYTHLLAKPRGTALLHSHSIVPQKIESFWVFTQSQTPLM